MGTQLQDYINQLAQHMCNSIGILQNDAPPIKFTETKLKQSETKIKREAKSTEAPISDELSQEEALLKQQKEHVSRHIELFSTLIARTTKDIDIILSSLPS